MDKNFHLDKVKMYLDGVLAQEEYLRTYKDCADDVYRVFSNLKEVSIREVESWLKGLSLGVDFYTAQTEPLAEEFAKNISCLTKITRSKDDVYWWALATAIWVYGGMTRENPMFRGVGVTA